jgi:hypothetical protein
MKKFALVVLAAFSMSAMADVRVIKSSLDATMTELPDGTFQVLNPTLNLGGTFYHIIGNGSSGRSVCEMVGKSFVDYQSTNISAATETVVNFKNKNAMEILEPVGRDYWPVFKVLTCK